MGEGPLPESSDQPSDAEAPFDGQAAPNSVDEPVFGGEPAEISPPPLSWPAATDQPTQISTRPPLAARPDTARPADLSQSLVGQRLEHFELKELVGGGGMGAVFRALDTRLNRMVAIKVLPRDQAVDDEIVRRFRNEAQSAARLDHDNIVRVYYVGEDKGHHFIAFEFVDGRNLRDLVVQRGPLPIATALNFTVQIADALAHASGRDVVHRDIKPSNVLITSDGRAKLADMGLARLHQIERSAGDLTASGVTLGTFDYISPEQARDPRNADVRSDIYSLGCTLFFMLTGHPPFPEGTVLQKLLQHQADEPPDPRASNPDVPPTLSRLLQRMMAKEPRQRHQSPEELISDLLAIANELGLEVWSTESPALAAPSAGQPSWMERHLVWMVPVTALVVVFVVLEISSWRQSRSTALRPLGESTGTDANAPFPASASAPGDNRALADEKHRPSAVIRASDALPNAPTDETVLRRPAQDPTTVRDSQPFQLGTANPAASIVSRPDESVDPISAAASAAVEASASASVDNATGLVNGGSDARTPSADPVLSPTPAPKPPRQSGVRIVSPGVDGEGVYPSLAAACAAAEAGDVIELQYDGRRDEKPLDLRNQRITIRAGEGFKPLIGFRPDDTDPVKYPRHMFNVSGGRLVLVNLTLELDLPRELPADSWSLFRLQQAEAMQIEHCSLTIRNAAEQGKGFHQDVAFLRVTGAPGAGSMMGTDEIGVVPVAIQLHDCFARGEGTFLVHTDVQPCSLSWSNGLLATTDRLLYSQGARKAAHSGDQLILDLRHLTADVRSGLCLFSNSIDSPYQLPAQIHLTNSIVLGTAKSAMIEQSGVDAARDFRRRLVWESDRNFYDGFTAFWKIQAKDEAPQVVEISGWRAFWRAERSWGSVLWRKLPDVSRPVSSVVVADYRLDDRMPNNDALRGATDGRDAGCDLNSLPQLTADFSAAGDRTSRAALPRFTK